MPPAGNTPRHPSQDEVRGRKGWTGGLRAQARSSVVWSHAGSGENPEGIKARRVFGRIGFRSAAVRTLRKDQGSGVDVALPRLAAWKRGPTTREHRPRERHGFPRGATPCRSNPMSATGMKQARTGVARCKPSRACETLRTEGGGWALRPR